MKKDMPRKQWIAIGKARGGGYAEVTEDEGLARYRGIATFEDEDVRRILNVLRRQAPYCTATVYGGGEPREVTFQGRVTDLQRERDVAVVRFEATEPLAEAAGPRPPEALASAFASLTTALDAVGDITLVAVKGVYKWGRERVSF